MTELVYRPEAVADVQDVVAWYDQQSPGLGDEFLRELQGSEKALRGSPTAFRVAYRSTRRYTVHRFPYQLLYRITDNVSWSLAVCTFGALRS